MIRILLISLERTRGMLLRKAADEVSHDLPEVTFLITNIIESDITEGRSIDVDEKIRNADVVILSHILQDEAVKKIREALLPEHERLIIVPLSCGSGLMRLVNIEGFSFTDIDKPVGEAKREVSMFRMLLGKIASEDDLASRLKELMEFVPKVLKFIPGTAKGIRSYLEAYLAWLEPTEQNLQSLVKILLKASSDDYVQLRHVSPAIAKKDGLYNPNQTETSSHRTTVGLLLPRSSVVSGETEYIDELIVIFDTLGVNCLAVFSDAFDSRETIEKYFLDKEGKSKIKGLVNLTGFPLVGGHIKSEPSDAVEMLCKLNVPYFVPITLTHQSYDDWKLAREGVAPAQIAANIALTELDGAIEPIVIAYADEAKGKQLIRENAERFASRVTRLTSLSTKDRSEKKLAVVIYCFPPSRGAVGTAAYLDVAKSLFALLHRLRDDGYSVDLPTSSEELLRDIIGSGDSYASSSSPLNISARISTRQYMQLVPMWRDAAKQWGEPPGDLNTDGVDLLIQGKEYGNVFVGVQPGFGYEGDPMRLLFTKNAAAHHGFLAFYAYIRHVWCADAVVHFGTHGALEFMPGKQNGLSAECYPHELIGDMPNVYLYSMNNPSEAAIAKRRSYATTISYLTPTNAQAGLYRGLEELHNLLRDIEAPNTTTARKNVVKELIIQKASEVHFEIDDADEDFQNLRIQLDEIRTRLIPLGLRIIGEKPSASDLQDVLFEMSKFERTELRVPSLLSLLGNDEDKLASLIATVLQSGTESAIEEMKSFNIPRKSEKDGVKIINFFTELTAQIESSDELTPIISALDGSYIEPGPGGDLLRVPQALPVGRNITSLNPFSIPSEVAKRIAHYTTVQLLQRARLENSDRYPECIGMVLWGLDNIKTGGEAIAQAFNLLGVEIGSDALGNMSRLKVIPLSELGRPRIDCVFTVSGIFRDMFGHQMNLLDQAIHLVAALDESSNENFIRKHFIEMTANGISRDEALYRVFSNASGTYGTNIEYMVQSGNWDQADDLADIFAKRKGYTFGAKRSEKRAPQILNALARYIDTTYQNLDSSEIGISDVDHYYEYLGGLTNLATVASGVKPMAYVADTTTANGVVRSLEETVALESRTKLLNPKWYEAMMRHGYEGVDEIKRRLDYTYGWSATAQAVPTWLYDEAHETFIANDELRQRMQKANPDAFNAMIERLVEADYRGYWEATAEQKQLLHDIHSTVLDELEGLPNE